jgi:hypothetical protein
MAPNPNYIRADELDKLVRAEDKIIRGHATSDGFRREVSLFNLRAIRDIDKGLELSEGASDRLKRGETRRSDIVLATLQPYTVAAIVRILGTLDVESPAVIPNFGLLDDVARVEEFAIRKWGIHS